MRTIDAIDVRFERVMIDMYAKVRYRALEPLLEQTVYAILMHSGQGSRDVHRATVHNNYSTNPWEDYERLM